VRWGKADERKHDHDGKGDVHAQLAGGDLTL
jgi:hypothetical protein